MGQAHLNAGRIGDDLKEFQRLSSLHPKEAVHHTQTAMALLEGGMGEEARKEADRAISVDPKSALAYRTTGWILQHDYLSMIPPTDGIEPRSGRAN